MKMCIYMYMKYVNVYILLELGKKAGQLVHPLASSTLFAFTDYTLPHYPL